MTKLNYALCVFIIFLSCETEEKKNVKAINFSEHSIKQSLLNGYFTKVSENIGVSVYQDDIFYFSTNNDGFAKNKFSLHLIKNDNSFENHDFFKDKYLLNDSMKGIFAPLQIIRKKINFDAYSAIRTGQFFRNESSGTTNIWSKKIIVKDIIKTKQKYQNEFSSIIKHNLLDADFKKELEYGRFFKSKADFYILLSDSNIYFLTSKSKQIDEKFMLHFIRKDNTFINDSFDYNNRFHQQFLEQPYKDLQIARINLPIYEDFFKIRIGQFDSTGNIWHQTIILDEVYSNELLIYNNEFDKQ